MGEITWRGATVAWAHPAELADFTTADLAAMGAAQIARHRQLDGVRAAGFLAGRALIRLLVLRLGGGPVVPLDSACARCGGDHGVPRSPGFTLSVSHADDLVAVAVARATTPLGVDIERNTSAARALELGPMFAPAPAPDLAGWTRIEAAVKADGRGIAIDPASVRMRPQGRNVESWASAPQEWSVALPERASRLSAVTLPGPVGYTLSVARG